ncbi:MAG: Maf family nucleotide pyrophosphatase [Candidatus Cryptobacteroides sp.]
MVQSHKIILGSGSPRRKELIGALDLDFTVDTKTGFEEHYPEDMPSDEVPLYLAEGKSQGFHRELADNEILITADTVVIVDGRVLGKPHSKEEAQAMLRSLSGKSHEVLTAVVLRSRDKKKSFTDSTKVCFAPLNESEISYYIDKYSPLDKAGAYGIQEWIGFAAITSIEGSFYNVMGLPVHRIYQELKDF